MHFNAVLVLLGIVVQNVAAVIVRVEQGRLRGEQKKTITGDTLYYSFKGIPYAAPPIGKLRFKAPQPLLSWTGIRNATEYGNLCPQFDGFMNRLLHGSEDCLFLNVYTQYLKPDCLLPVMFFIHGGAFVYGSGNDDFYGPDFLLDESRKRKKPVIVVTINYRLGELGFLSLDTAGAPGNAGMKDQVEALRWVQRNIEQFGGDPNKVTIFGESAGGIACTYHILSPMSRGLFRRVIAMSGVARDENTVEFEPQRRAVALAKRLGFVSKNTTEILEFFQNVPAERLIITNTTIIAAEQYMALRLLSVPVVEKDFGQERFLIEPLYVSVKKGRSDVDIILGYTSNEGIATIPVLENSSVIENYARYPEVLVSRNVFYQSTPKMHLKLADLIKQYYTGSKLTPLKTIPQIVSYVTDAFVYPTIRYANDLFKFSRSDGIYLYEFSSISERNFLNQFRIRYGLTGVGHAEDLMYVFHSKFFNFPVNKNATSYRMIRQICALFINFAIYVNPTPDASLGAIWPKYNTDSRVYMDIGENLTLGTNPRQSAVDLYESIYKVAGLKG